MACVQGTWWGVGGGVVGGWWGSWLWCRVSGWGWVLRLGCLVGGGVRLAGPGFLLAAGVAGGAVPLRPLLNSLPHPLGGLWVLVRAVPLLGGVVACWWVSVGCSSFSRGWAGLVGGLSCWLCSGWGCSQPGVVVAVLVGRLGSAVCLLGVFRGGGLCGLCLCRGVVLRLVVLFPLGGPTWTVGLFVAPLFLPPQYTMKALRPPNPVGELTR